jgi:hypothetical protein
MALQSGQTSLTSISISKSSTKTQKEPLKSKLVAIYEAFFNVILIRRFFSPILGTAFLIFFDCFITRLDFHFSVTTSHTDSFEPILGWRSKHKEWFVLGWIFFVEGEFFLFGDNDRQTFRRWITQTEGPVHFIFTLYFLLHLLWSCLQFCQWNDMMWQILWNGF